MYKFTMYFLLVCPYYYYLFLSPVGLIKLTVTFCFSFSPFSVLSIFLSLSFQITKHSDVPGML